ncbi:MAG: DNA polymerase III subunit gamma/tau, partial [Ruminiclostridium sp.]|nr:DNA polymerase III subunit gamma/tau [Ruminiclostridium sp.]
MYLALYRKYRPSTFDDVISQEHITTTLRNQIETGQIAHAYLFTGTRGTGKTSCAKIMAKAVNCLSPENGSPCGRCAVCKAIEEGSTDIIEIDAASNNGVDNIRQIRDEIIYTPIDCKYKVYIIDEVHMLSPGAFNALLKTLEEPPTHVIFILATTEYYKIPATILSRCQQFLFSKIDAEESAKRLIEIAEKENVTLEPAAARFIARLADGAMRDALSLLDQCISVSDRIDEDLVRQCSGAADSEYLFAVSQAAIDKAPADALGILDKLIVQGKDISRFIEELTAHYRNLMLEKTAVEELIKASGNELEQYRRQSKVYSLDEIMYHIDLISDSLDNINRMKQTGQARLLTEQLLIRLTAPRLANDASALAARIGSLENRLERLAETGLAAVREERAEKNKAIPPKTEEKAEKAASEFKEEQAPKSAPKE